MWFLAASDRVVGRLDYGGVLIVRALLGFSWVELLVDTGSAITALTPRTIGRIGLDPSQFAGRREIATAAGTSRIVRASRVPILRLGGIVVRNVEISILDMPPGLNVDGLLGMNVLGQFRVTLEFRRAVLVLRPDRSI